MTARNDVRTAMSRTWRRPHEIHKRMAMWSPQTVQKYLRVFVDDGVAESDGGEVGERSYRLTEAEEPRS